MLTEAPNPRKGEGGEEQLATPVCTKNTDGGLSIAILGVLAGQRSFLESYFVLRQSALNSQRGNPQNRLTSGVEGPSRGVGVKRRIKGVKWTSSGGAQA